MKEFRMKLLFTLLAVGALWGVLLMQSMIAKAMLDEESSYVDADLIRVGISDDNMTAWEYPLTQISGTGPFTVQDKATGMSLLNARAGEVVTVTVDQTGFHLKSNLQTVPATPPPSSQALLKNTLNDLVQRPGPLLVSPVKPNDRLKIMNITRRKEIPQFRGVFEIVRGSSSPNKLTAVNVVSLEDYLKAVVPNELPMRYGLEAVRAQAVAARNYAIRPREKPWKVFDICDSQLCQVYLGSQTETPDSNRAIADTEGLVGVSDGEPILALFSSSHGGYAEDYSYAFSDPKTKQYPAPPIRYLKGGPDIAVEGLNLRTEEGARKFWTNPGIQSFDVESPYYRWDKRWTRAELEATINRGLLTVSKDGSTKDFVSPLFKPTDSIGVLKSIKVLERGTSGKAMVVAIEGSRGVWTIKKEFLIRKVLMHGGRMLPSGNVVFTPVKDPKGQLIAMRAQGGGFGHGVGMSQLGASWMHKHGYRFPQIIQHYYKGVSLASRPITVGAGQSDRPVVTRFDVSRAKGMLWIQDGENGNGAPVKIKLNGKELKLASNGARSGTEVDTYLRPGELNTLVLFPDEKHPQRKLKAWIDLYPPQG